jgi:hypothetical protein
MPHVSRIGSAVGAGHKGVSPKGKRLMVWQVYADESGKGQQPVFVLAGWLADSTAWASFSADWKRVLSEPPTIQYFHMVEAWHRNKQFQGWSIEARDAKVGRLASLVKQYVKCGIHCLVFQAAYHLHIKGIDKQFNDPYVISSYLLMIDAVKFFASKGIAEPIDFIFDKQPKESNKVQSLYGDFIQLVPDEYRALIGAQPRYENDKHFVALQAADMLAWHIRREQSNDFDKNRETAAFDIFEIEQQKIVIDVDMLARVIRS